MTQQTNTFPTPPPALLTVSQLTLSIKEILEGRFRSIWVEGEVSNFKQQSSGHLYFSLKDNSAQISAVMFRGNAIKLSALPKDGDHIAVGGEISVYPPHGKYQLIIREVQQVGLGALLLKFQQLKTELQKRGWFALERKLPLPKFPKVIGVVTSPTGAVIQDIVNVLKRRHNGFQLILSPVRVQGEGAAQEIAQAIRQFNEHGLADVLIVGRGGGSVEDLWAFNEEVVAEAIFQSKIPVISAVGHESDHSIADLVADIRAPTPSAAAEIVMKEGAHHLEFLSQMQRRISQTMLHLVKGNRQQLEGLIRHPLFASPYALLGSPMQKVDDMRLDIDASMRQLLQKKRMELIARQKQAVALRPTSQLIRFRERLYQLNRSIHAAWKTGLEQKRRALDPQNKIRTLSQAWQRSLTLRRERLTKLTSSLQAIDPKNLLRKGYSILFAENKASVIFSTKQLVDGQQIKALLSDGKVDLTVNIYSS